MVESELQSINHGCLVLVRHGETAWNREEVFRGRADVPLNEMGLAQARAAARALETEPVEAVYSSPLIRALDTAKAIAAVHDLPVSVHEGLTDFDCGEWQGQTLGSVRETYTELFQQWADAPHTVQLPGGETLEQARERAMRTVHEIFGLSTGNTVVAVTHRVINKVLLCALLGLDNSHFWNIFQSNACTNRIVFDPHGPEIHTLNDTSHLNQTGADALTTDF